MLDLADHLRPWHELPICVIDFETTGPDPNECAPVEVAVVRFERGEPIARWSSLVNPVLEIPEEATAVHGIRNEDVANALPYTHLTSAIRVNAGDMLNGAIPCGYNGDAFDRVVLHRHYHGCDNIATRRDWPWLDPLVMVRHVDPFVKGKGRHKLAAACDRHGIELALAHRATADAEACGRLLHAKRIRAALGDRTIGEVLRRQRFHAAEQERQFQEWLAKQPPQPSEATTP